jgi:hypothetical protein
VLENGNMPNSHNTTNEQEDLLDALSSNDPLKCYEVSFDSIDQLTYKNLAPQMHLTEEDRRMVEANGTVLLLGRYTTIKSCASFFTDSLYLQKN